MLVWSLTPWCTSKAQNYANMFVIIMTNRFINQKLRTIMWKLKKKLDTKNSALIKEYINGDPQ